MMASRAAGFSPEASQEAGQLWEAMADNLPAMLRCTDTLGHCGFVNRAWRNFTGLAADEAHGRGWEQAVHPEDLGPCRTTLELVVAEPRPFRLGYRLRRADGEWRWVVEEGRPLFHHDRLAHLMAECMDVTEMQQALADRRRMVDEREALVLELQHRVRNNAQATSSVLSLQAARSRDPVVAAALRGAAARVLLATQVQDRMFRMAGTATVELGPEVTAAAHAACDLAGQDRSRLELVVAPAIEVLVRQAAPLALIVNELTTNALHHAFPPGSNGRVRVTLRRAAPGQAELEVADDGIGLPEPIGGPAVAGQGLGQGLGLHLAARLASQAGATLVVEAPAAAGLGTRLRLHFAATDADTSIARC